MALVMFSCNRICHHNNVLHKLMHIRHWITRNSNPNLGQSISCYLRPVSHYSVRQGLFSYVRQPVISSVRQSNLYCKQNLSSFSVIYSQSNQDDFVNHQQILPISSGHHKNTFCAAHFKSPGSLLFAQRRNNHILCEGYQSVHFRTGLKINTVRSFSDLKRDEELKSFLNEIVDDFQGEVNNSSMEKDSNKKTRDIAKDRETTVEAIQISPRRGKVHDIKEKGDEQKYNTTEAKDKYSTSQDNSTVVQKSDSSASSSEPDEEIEDFVGGEKEEEVQEEVEPSWTSPISLIRGTSGVFELDELMVVLRESNAIDSCVLRLPPEAKLAEYMVIVSGTSVRHILAIAQEIRKIHKKKKGPGDPHLVIEGMETKDWLAINLGNIILHIFLPETRAMYDLELLWTVGEKYDDMCLKQQQESYIMSIDDLPWLKELESSDKDQASKSGKK